MFHLLPRLGLLLLAISSTLIYAADGEPTTVARDTVEAAIDSFRVDTISAVLPTARLPFVLGKPSAKEIKVFQAAWQQALFAFRNGHFAEAARRLRTLQASEQLVQLYRADFFAEASLAAGSRRDADSALEAALRWVRGPVWQRHLYRLRLESFDFNTASPGSRKEFCLRALKAPLAPPMRAEFLHRLLALDSSFLPDLQRMAALRQLLRDAPVDSRLDSVYQGLTARFPPGQEAWEWQKLLMDFEAKLGYWQKALDRAQVMASLAPGKTEKQELELNSADFWFRKGSYAEAVKRYQRYEKSYGSLQDIFMQEARAWRRLGDGAQADSSYSRLVEQYPHNPKAADIHWMRAFDAEAAGKAKEAMETYARLAEDFPESRYAERAAFRIGLTQYKQGNFAVARKAFQNLRSLNKSSRIIPAGIYWEAKSLESMGDSAGAQKIRLELSARFPFSFYGHLAHSYLRSRNAWPDSLEWNRRFASSDSSEVKSWLAAHAPGFQNSMDQSGESDYLPVSRLLEWRMDTLAVLTLRSQPSAFLSNPWALYLAGRQCQGAELWTDAFRFGTLLGNLLPMEEWPKAPRSVLRMFYPPAYEGEVRTWAARDSLPAGLVFALMKQESGFDPLAVSGAGARGLMQMMPATGALLAKQEMLSGFTADSLFNPGLNIRLGVAYLRDLERRHHGDLYFTLAHYNAGPGALADWMPRLTGLSADQIAEDIDYTETREYVKRVLANYWTYQMLYE